MASEKKELALRAIVALFSDIKRAKEDIVDDLYELQDDIETRIDALEIDIAIKSEDT